MIWEMDFARKSEPPTRGRALFNSAARGDAEAVRNILNDDKIKEADILEQVNGQNAFHVACKKGFTAIVTQLMSLVLTETADGRSGLQLAAFEGRLEVVKVISASGDAHRALCHEDKAGNTALHFSCWGGHLEVIQFLVGNFPELCSLDRRNIEGMTGMQYASAGNHVQVVQFLSSCARSPGQEDPSLLRSEAGYTSLHKACQYGALDAVKLLLSEGKGRDVNSRSKNGTTPLHLVVQHGHEELVRLLISGYSADVNAQTEHLLTPLHFAALAGHAEIAQFLLDLPSVDVGLVSATGAHALHLAAASGSLAICEALVMDKHVDPFVTDKENNSPIDAALGSGFKELAGKLANWSAIRLRASRLLRLAASSPSTPPPQPRVRVLFCGMGHFESGFLLTRQALLDDVDVEVVQCERDEVLREIRSATVVVPLMTRITAELVESAPKLKLITQFGVGLEGVDVPACTARKIAVAKIPSEGVGNAESCAEHAILLALSVLRDVKGLQQSVLRGRLGYPTGGTIFGSTALIVGYGGLGRQLAQRLRAFGLKSLFVVKQTALGAREAEADPLVRNGCVCVGTMGDLLASTSASDCPARTANIVFVTCTLHARNAQCINAKFLGLFAPGLVLVNVARGGLVDYADLRTALDSGHVGGAGLDVYHTEPFPSPADDSVGLGSAQGVGLLAHPRVIATPHVAGVTEVSYENMAQRIARNVRLVMKGKSVPDQVNLV